MARSRACKLLFMAEPKSALGVSHAIIDGNPRIVLALFLDHPGVQVTTDDDGRPIAMAVLEPEAAYNGLVTRIIAAYDAATGGAPEA
jgi:hypothetical protein